MKKLKSRQPPGRHGPFGGPAPGGAPAQAIRAACAAWRGSGGGEAALLATASAAAAAFRTLAATPDAGLDEADAVEAAGRALYARCCSRRRPTPRCS